MKADLEYARTELPIDLVEDYISQLKSREPPCKESMKKEYIEWSSMKTAAETILERILEGFNPVVVAEDYVSQMDYFSYKANESGNYETSDMFAIECDTALDILQIFADNDIHYEEEIYNE